MKEIRLCDDADNVYSDGDSISDFVIEGKLELTLISTLGKILKIVEYCGYDFEKYIKNYLNWVSYKGQLDYDLFEVIDVDNRKVPKNELIKMKELHKKDYFEIITFFEDSGIIFDGLCNNLNEELFFLSAHYDFLGMLDNKVKYLLISALRMYSVDTKVINPDNYVYSDYTYLIVNYVKSLESFMAYKLDQTKRFEKDNVYSATFYRLEEMIKECLNDKKNIPDDLKDSYLGMLSRFREIYRNGYFHKDILKRKKAYITMEIAKILIVLTELMIQN